MGMTCVASCTGPWWTTSSGRLPMSSSSGCMSSALSGVTQPRGVLKMAPRYGASPKNYLTMVSCVYACRHTLLFPPLLLHPLAWHRCITHVCEICLGEGGLGGGLKTCRLHFSSHPCIHHRATAHQTRHLNSAAKPVDMMLSHPQTHHVRP